MSHQLPILNTKARFWRVQASEVKVGDILCFDTPGQDVKVERISIAQMIDASIGLHANGGTWSSFYRPDEIVRIR